MVLAALRPRHPSYTALSLPNHPDIDASLAYVIAGWPVIDPLYRFRYAKEIHNQNHIDAHIAYWQTEEAMAEGSPPTIVEDGRTHSNYRRSSCCSRQTTATIHWEMQERFIASYRKRGGAIEVHTFEGLPEHGMNTVAGAAGNHACHGNDHHIYSAASRLALCAGSPAARRPAL